MPSTPHYHGFDEFFLCATGKSPFPFQREFAGEGARDGSKNSSFPALVDVPTGLGKTAMAVLGWLWRRRFASDDVRRETPRRLIYCLPMRMPVEQTRDNTIRWLFNLELLAGTVEFDPQPAKNERATEQHRIVKYVPPSASENGDGESDRIAVYVLMGGEDEPAWDIYPERDAIIIGTQDMLLSRALNRGYAASRARWPMQFGVLNTDSLWLFDEVQLMGSGLGTTTQLEAFRQLFSVEGGAKGNGCASVWMSATLQPEWLKTVDFKGRIDDQGCIDGKSPLSLTDADHENDQVATRWNAKKRLAKATSDADDPAALAPEVRAAHMSGTRTIVVVNTVKRACAIFEALNKISSTGKPKKRGSNAAASPPAAAAPKLVLLHSRFRPSDRALRIAEALAPVEPGEPGTIVVSTQVIEAGVDVSAATLFTELAPWASLIQRIGRCNRRGEENDAASVHWIDLPPNDAAAQKLGHPYELADLRAAAEELARLKDVGPGSLAAHRQLLPKEKCEALFPHRHTHVIRRREFLDLFDTTPDLAGNDIDIDRYVRDIEETDVRVFWRDWGEAKRPPADTPQPLRSELCPAPAWGELGFKDFVIGRGKGKVFRYDYLNEKWEAAGSEAAPITSGQVYMVRADAGGYTPSTGWDPKSDEAVMPPADETTGVTRDWEAFSALLREKKQPVDLTYDDDGLSVTDQFQSIQEHTDKVCKEMEGIVAALNEREAKTLGLAARWHDWGKIHEQFQIKIYDGPEETDPKDIRRVRRKRPDQWAGRLDIAKAPGRQTHRTQDIFYPGYWFRRGAAKDRFRKFFRHELASALGVLQQPHPDLKSLDEEELNLVAYLIAAHHGKVRLSIRSISGEHKHQTQAGWTPKRFARGVWEGDPLSSVDLGGGVTAPCVTLSLEPMELGLGENGQPSWVERVLRLRDRFGPFRLAYLEAILRAADIRASVAVAAHSMEASNA